MSCNKTIFKYDTITFYYNNDGKPLYKTFDVLSALYIQNKTIRRIKIGRKNIYLKTLEYIDSDMLYKICKYCNTSFYDIISRTINYNFIYTFRAEDLKNTLLNRDIYNIIIGYAYDMQFIEELDNIESCISFRVKQLNFTYIRSLVDIPDLITMVTDKYRKKYRGAYYEIRIYYHNNGKRYTIYEEFYFDFWHHNLEDILNNYRDYNVVTYVKSECAIFNKRYNIPAAYYRYIFSIHNYDFRRKNSLSIEIY